MCIASGTTDGHWRAPYQSLLQSECLSWGDSERHETNWARRTNYRGLCLGVRQPEALSLSRSELHWKHWLDASRQSAGRAHRGARPSVRVCENCYRESKRIDEHNDTKIAKRRGTHKRGERLAIGARSGRSEVGLRPQREVVAADCSLQVGLPRARGRHGYVGKDVRGLWGALHLRFRERFAYAALSC